MDLTMHITLLLTYIYSIYLQVFQQNNNALFARLKFCYYACIQVKQMRENGICE